VPRRTHLGFAMCVLDKATVRELAVRASVDPRSITRALAGESVRGMAGHRARRVLQEAGLLPEQRKAEGQARQAS